MKDVGNRTASQSGVRSLLKRVPGLKRLYRDYGSLRRLSGFDQESLNQQLQKLLLAQYRSDLRRGTKTYDDIAEAGFRCYSQFEEDGIILYVLSLIGMTTKKVVEVCCGDAEQCMATNLILNHGFTGYLFDGDKNNIRNATRFFSSKRDCLLTPPKLRAAWITKDNINDLLRSIGASGEVDLLSLDIDGNDYYVWEAMDEINPRLCVLETSNIVPGNLSLTVPYDPDFNCWDKTGPEQDFRSVSLLAMKRLSERKGYRLIGGHKHGFNVFFLRNDIGTDIFQEVTIEHVHNNQWTRIGQLERWPLAKDRNWVEV